MIALADSFTVNHNTNSDAERVICFIESIAESRPFKRHNANVKVRAEFIEHNVFNIRFAVWEDGKSYGCAGEINVSVSNSIYKSDKKLATFLKDLYCRIWEKYVILVQAFKQKGG